MHINACKCTYTTHMIMPTNTCMHAHKNVYTDRTAHASHLQTLVNMHTYRGNPLEK